MRGIGGHGISKIQDSGIGGTLSPSEALSHSEALSPGEIRCHPGGSSEGMGFPKSRIRVSAGPSAPVRPRVPARPVVTLEHGISEIQDSGIGETLSPSEAPSPGETRCHSGDIGRHGIPEVN